jgi:hypothetical protein
MKEVKSYTFTKKEKPEVFNALHWTIKARETSTIDGRGYLKNVYALEDNRVFATDSKRMHCIKPDTTILPTGVYYVSKGTKSVITLTMKSTNADHAPDINRLKVGDKVVPLDNVFDINQIISKIIIETNAFFNINFLIEAVSYNYPTLVLYTDSEHLIAIKYDDKAIPGYCYLMPIRKD